MGDLVDIAIPANAQAVAEALGLVVSRSVTNGARIRGIARDEAEIAVACLHDYGVVARIVEMAKSTLLKLLRRFAALHAIGAINDELIADTRSR